ncbi:MAG: hypothetical protein IJ083_05880 [Clostridia bacterium]|nr:hypothetical protein [Clostridia bacterium]
MNEETSQESRNGSVCGGSCPEGFYFGEACEARQNGSACREPLRATAEVEYRASCVPEKKKTGERRQIGILADSKAWIADDFNDPLPEFEEYMQA